MTEKDTILTWIEALEILNKQSTENEESRKAEILADAAEYKCSDCEELREVLKVARRAGGPWSDDFAERMAIALGDCQDDD